MFYQLSHFCFNNGWEQIIESSYFTNLIIFLLLCILVVIYNVAKALWNNFEQVKSKSL